MTLMPPPAVNDASCETPAPTAAPARVLAIWTRDRQASSATGRGRLIQGIRAAMGARFAVEDIHLRHVLDPALRRQAWRLPAELAPVLRRQGALPLQCLLYLPRFQLRRLLAARTGPAPEIVYLDSVRAAPLLPELRRAFPKARLVLDMDDLMSRRWVCWQRAGIGLTVGFLEAYLPARALRLVEHGLLARRILGFETAALKALELQAARAADLIVLNSPLEGAIYRRLATRKGGPVPRVAAIPPPAPAVAPVDWTGQPRLRFAFIGTDQLPQNRLTIEHLLDLWRRLAPPAELVIVGRLQRAYPPVPNVTLAGFVPDLHAVYTTDTVLVSPAFVRGGIKTKVAEAFAHGCPVLGNAATFEGMDLPRNYPLRLPTAGIETVVAAPERHRDLFVRAAAIGRTLAVREFSEERFRQRWVEALAGTGAAA